MSDAFYGGGSSGAADPNLIQRLMAYIGGGGGGPPQDPRAKALADAQAQLRGGSPPNSNLPPTLGPVAPIQSAAQIPTNLPPAAAPSVAAPPAAAPPMARPGGIGSDANFPVMGAGGFPTTYAAPGQQPPVPTPAAAVPYPPVRPKNLGQPVVRKSPGTIPAGMTASVPPAGKSPWVTKDAQNQDWSGGALARGGTRQMGMLDLSQLFGR